MADLAKALAALPKAQPLDLAFNASFGSRMVLQQAPARAAVYGTVRSHAPPHVAVRVVASREYTVRAIVSPSPCGSGCHEAGCGQLWHWLARLPPTPTTTSREHTIIAHASSNTSAKPETRTLERVRFGDVWLCAGQSNMEFQLCRAFDDDAATAAAASGRFQNIHLLDTSCNPPTRATASKQHSCGWSKDGDKAARWLSAHDATANRTVGCDLSAALPACAGRATPLGAFSAVCFHFAAALSEQLRRAGRTPPPIGLINVAVGSSAANEWMPPGSGAKCRYSGSSGKTRGGELWRSNAHPHAATALKGVLWYQGEHDCNKNFLTGNVLHDVGYGCELPELVRGWRAAWATTARIGAEVEPSSEPEAPMPFGVVALASGGCSGPGYGGSNYGWELGGLRDSQTANFGVLPSPSMPHTFVAQTYDLAETFPRLECKGWKCCADTADFSPSQCNASHELAREKFGLGFAPPPAGGIVAACAAACASWATHPLHSPSLYGLHPRVKRQVGERLARAALTQVYGGGGARSGPTISGCAVHGRRLSLKFNASLLNGEKLHLRGKRGALSPLQVLVNASQFCRQPLMRCPAAGSTAAGGCNAAVREWWCPDGLGFDGGGFGAVNASLITSSRSANWPRPPSPYDAAHEVGGACKQRVPGACLTSWVSLDIARLLSATTAEVDLAPLGGAAPVAVRYGWGDHAQGPRQGCCDDGDPYMRITRPCEPEACPLWSEPSHLPANPFRARILGGRCACDAPQVCAE